MRAARTATLLASWVALSSLGAAAQSDTAVTIPASDAVPADAASVVTKPGHVLFIGNSHTYTNGGVDLHVGRMAQGSDPPIPFSADSVIRSGATLEDHWEFDAQGRIPEGHYAVVVLQDHIPRSADRTASAFLANARLFDEVADQYGVDTVFFMSGPHRDFPAIRLKDIVKAHREIATELGARVAPVALANRKVGRQRPDLEMLAADGVHASWAGTYLAAAVIYATLFDQSPEGVDYAFGVSRDDAAYLQQVAWQTVTEWRADATR